jgi:hypothetical protein
MSDEQFLRHSFVSLQVNGDFSEAVLAMADGSRLCFCHRVGERWAKALPAPGPGEGPGLADRVLGQISMFRLNAKHLDVQFHDGSSWDARLGVG